MDQPDVAGDGPALRPDVPVEQQVRLAAAARRRRRLVAGGSALVVAVAAAVLAGRAAPDPARSPAAPTPPAAPAGSPADLPAWSPEQVIDVAVGNDTLYALLGGCAGPEQGRSCYYRLTASTRGGGWEPLSLPAPPAEGGAGFAARLLLTGGETLTVVDEPRRQAYVRAGDGPFAVRTIRAGPPLTAGMPAGLVPELVAGRVSVLDPATGLRRPLAAQPRLGAAPLDVAGGPLGDLWAVAEPGPRVVVAHSADGGRSWRSAAVPGLRAGLGEVRLVPGQDGTVYLFGSRPGGERTELWRLPGTGGTWSRVGGAAGPRSVGSVAPGRSGLVLTDATGSLWRLSAGGAFRRLPDPVVAGAAVRAGALFSGPGGRMVSQPAGGAGAALLLVSADDGDSWLPTLTPG